MDGRRQVVLVLALVLVQLVQQVSSWKEEKPIYKWSPRWFNDNRFLYKRYNDDKPIYKWNPYWLSNGGFYVPGKREAAGCAAVYEPCAYSRQPCCDDLHCQFFNGQFLCMDPYYTYVDSNEIRKK